MSRVLSCAPVVTDAAGNVQQETDKIIGGANANDPSSTRFAFVRTVSLDAAGNRVETVRQLHVSIDELVMALTKLVELLQQ